jgi:preprotein translocase SecE subunit
MTAFWTLFALMAYGLLEGFRLTLRGWFGNSSLNEPWVAQFPILGKLDLATFIAVVLLAVSGVVIHRLLNKPKTADLLIETESELKKVTWPSLTETWNGSIAVIVTVIALMLYLTVTDMALVFVLMRAMGG